MYVDDKKYRYRKHVSPMIVNNIAFKVSLRVMHVVIFSTFFHFHILTYFKEMKNFLFQHGDTPSHLAVAGRNLEITQMLLERTDADFNQVNEVRDADPTRMFSFYF